jgi:putative membrane protein
LGISVALIAAALFFLRYWGYGSATSFRGFWPMSQGGHGGMMAYGGGWGMGSGWGIGSGMGIGMLLFWGVIIVAIVLLIGGAFSKSGQPHIPADRSDDALEILKKRYARGEIDKTEFEAKRRDLKL